MYSVHTENLGEEAAELLSFFVELSSIARLGEEDECFKVFIDAVH